MYDTNRLWWTLGVIVLVSFAILGFMGGEIYRAMPPVPDAYISADGETLYTREDIERGRQVWQTTGGHQQGSIWGHGAYLAPDWTADWLHREALALLEIYAQREFATGFDVLSEGRQAGLKQRLKTELRANTWDSGLNRVTVSSERAAAIREVAAHYDGLFGNEPELAHLREAYAMMHFPVPDAERRQMLGAFVFWSAWAAATNRPDDTITYTNNWPHEQLVGNTPSGAAFMWTFVSILVLLAGVAALAWHYATIHGREAPPEVPAIDPLHNLKPTPSMRATVKYFWVVTAMFALQVILGGITAHYAVEGQGFYGYNLSEVLPYVVTRTWHTQLAVMWIATAWLATGLYIGPAISGHEPKFQRLGVNVLFACLLVIVAGSMLGQWLGVMQKLGLDINFWFGHQGWEYVDLGRFWQIFLFIGLMLWLLLVGRALWPALKKKDEGRPLVILLFLSTVAIGLFYGAGLMWGKHTHLSIVEYWRWWVVHLWVEGFFEVFATAVIAFLFTKLGLVRVTSAVTAVLFATIVFLTGGVLGTFHHLYFAGTPTAVLAIGASFSALEVVPLVLIGFEAYENWRASQHRGWVATYKWPIMFFISVAFWNLVGAGLFGFLINPPLALYYMQGLNTTALHAHTALFGVYGMLGIGLMLFCLRGLTYRQVWNEKLLKLSFWSLNLGLAAMAVFSLLPIGLMQVYASVTEGFWYARSADFLQQPVIQALVWLRVPGDVLFSVGVLALAWFIFRLFFGPRESLPVAVPSPVADA